jgi:putative transposase
MLADHCAMYNAALQERRDAYRHPSRTRIRYGDQSVQLKDIRAFDPEGQGRWSFSSQQATLRRLNRAFEAFFHRTLAGQKPGYPRFRSLARFDTVDFPKDGDGCRWDSTQKDRHTRVRLQGIGNVRVHQHRPIQGRVKTISVKREGRRWYVIISCDQVRPEPLPATGRQIGVDMGVAHFVSTSDGVHIANPRHLIKAADRLADAQRTLATYPTKAKKRTKKHRRAARKIARLHAKVRRQRLDFAHKAANFLIQDADVIAHEELNIAGMTRRPKPKPTEHGAYQPNGASAKTGLNKAILDAGWGVFLGILADKAECAGRKLIPVDPRNTSRTCPACRHISRENRDREVFECTACGHADHADRVAALNVATRAGLALCAVA